YVRRFPGTWNGDPVVTLDWSPRRSPWEEPWEGGDEYVTVSFTSVLSTQRTAAEEAYLRDTIPELAVWLVRASVAPEGWRILRHRRVWTWRSGRVEASGDEVV